MNQIDWLLAATIGLLCITFVWVGLERRYEQEAVQAECAQYNPQTGRFEWLVR